VIVIHANRTLKDTLKFVTVTIINVVAAKNTGNRRAGRMSVIIKIVGRAQHVAPEGCTG
jgi:hypothetical protein